MNFWDNPNGHPWNAFPLPSGSPSTTQASPAPPATSSTPAPAPSAPAPTGSTATVLGADQQNAYTALQGMLNQAGLGSLAPTLLSIIQQGYTDTNAIDYLLSQTPEWKSRFQGNELLKQKGLPVLEPGAYLDLERQYATVLKSYGIPDGMFSSSDFAQWIGNSVSPSEIQGRVQMAADNVTNSDPYFRQALGAMGVDTGHLTAYYLDQKRALPFLQRQEQASQIGAEALRQHLNLDPNTALALASMGVTQDQARSGYQQIGAELPTMQKLAQITPGATFNQQTAEQQVLFGDAAANQQAFRLANTEEERFAGSSGVGTSPYHPGYGLSIPLQGSY